MTSVQVASIRAQGPQTNDTALRDHVAYHMETSPTVKKYDIDVKVERHNVTLTGTVATEAQKVEAGRLARVEGVTHVDNELKVDRDVNTTLTDRARRGMRRTGEALDDGWITTKVKWFFTGDSLLKGSDISVETNNRVVVLSGTVRTESARQRAVALANDTDGVTKVVDHLRIQR
jgi:osmotically-inducible protein OsmY